MKRTCEPDALPDHVPGLLSHAGRQSRGLAWLLILFLLQPVAMANPTVLPHRVVAAIVVIGAALVVEALLTALVLVFFQLISFHLIWVLLLVNAVLYPLVFLPLMGITGNVPISEIIIVAIEALIIKMLSRIGAFQTGDFRRLPWLGAFLAAAVGNASSFLVGLALAGADLSTPSPPSML